MYDPAVPKNRFRIPDGEIIVASGSPPARIAIGAGIQGKRHTVFFVRELFRIGTKMLFSVFTVD